MLEASNKRPDVIRKKSLYKDTYGKGQVWRRL